MRMTAGPRPRCGAYRSPEDLDELVVDELHDLVTRPDPVEHGGPDGLLAYVGDERHDPEVDVSLEQGEPHLAQRRVEIGLGQRPVAAQAGGDGLGRTDRLSNMAARLVRQGASQGTRRDRTAPSARGPRRAR